MYSTPGRIATAWTSYPYYASHWFSPVGRSLLCGIQRYHFGGKNGG